MPGVDPVNLVVTLVLPPKTGSTPTRAPSTSSSSTMLVMTGASSLHRQAGGHIAAVVAGAEHDGVGRIGRDRVGHGRCEGRAGQAAGQVAGRQHLRGAVGAQGGGEGVAGATDDGNDRVSELGGLGQQLQGGGGGLAVALFGLGEVGIDPNG
jgi:hypothetical protein